jgi:hypothetical protein
LPFKRNLQRYSEAALAKAKAASHGKMDLFTRVDIPLTRVDTETDWRGVTSEVPLSPAKYRQLRRDRELDKLGLLTRTDAAVRFSLPGVRLVTWSLLLSSTEPSFDCKHNVVRKCQPSAAASAVPKRRKAAIIAEGLHAAWELAHECRASGSYDADCCPGIVLAISHALRRPELPLRSLVGLYTFANAVDMGRRWRRTFASSSARRCGVSATAPRA